jgi:hypothetical protein
MRHDDSLYELPPGAQLFVSWRVPALKLLSHIRVSVTNNWWLDLLDVVITISLDYNSSHFGLLLDNETLTVVWISDWSLVSRILYLEVWISDWTHFMRTEYRIPGLTVDCPVLFSVATKRVTRWFIQACSLPQKRVLAGRCLATDISAVLLWLHTSGFQPLCHIMKQILLPATAVELCSKFDKFKPYCICKDISSLSDRLCGLVVRVCGYRSRGPGSIPGATRFLLRSTGSETGPTQPREYNWGAISRK